MWKTSLLILTQTVMCVYVPSFSCCTFPVNTVRFNIHKTNKKSFNKIETYTYYHNSALNTFYVIPPVAPVLAIVTVVSFQSYTAVVLYVNTTNKTEYRYPIKLGRVGM